MLEQRPQIPRQTRRAVMQRCKGVCEGCGERSHITLHHLHYDSVGCELPGDLEALCWPCHQQRHRDLNGEYWRDPQEMFWHWYGYFEEDAKE